jgi:hypothetical protein
MGSGQFCIHIGAPAATAKSGTPAPAAESGEFVQQIVNGLSRATEREAGTRLLKERQVTKDVLRSVARVVGACATSKDTKDILVQRIVESTIGFRLRAAAIQGAN